MDERLRHLATSLLAEVTHLPVRPFFTIDFGREQSRMGVSVLIPEQQGEDVLHQVRERLEPGLVAFLGTTRLQATAEAPRLIELVVGAGTSQFDILRLARTDAVNYQMLTEDLIGTLMEIDHRYGITITQAESDTVVFELRSFPPDLMAFAREIYEFCPDIVDQGVGTVEALAEGIDVTGRVVLWWD